MIATSVKKFDSKKQLTRGDLREENNILTVNLKWFKTWSFKINIADSYTRFLLVSCQGLCKCFKYLQLH